MDELLEDAGVTATELRRVPRQQPTVVELQLLPAARPLRDVRRRTGPLGGLRPTMFGCSSTATPKTSATLWRWATNRRFSRGCRYRNAGVTDLAVRVVPLGPDVRARGASRRRTREFAASLFSEFA